MRVGRWANSHNPPLTLSREADRFALRRSSPLPMGEGKHHAAATVTD